MMTTKLTQNEAITLLQTYGAHPDFWPAHQRLALQEACDQDPLVAAARNREAQLDYKLHQLFEPASDAMEDKILSKMINAQGPTSVKAERNVIQTVNRIQLSASVSALVACLLLGFFGAGLVDQELFFHTEADTALAYSSLELWTAFE